MNILYIFGNGFDKAQGLKTSYPEFYEHLDKQEGSTLLQGLKSNIKKDTKLWADMEKAFGEYTSLIDSPQDFISLYEELSGQLQDYLKSEDSQFTPTVDQKERFKKDFLSFRKYFGELDQNRYNQYVDKFRNESRNIYVMTLNYTSTLEKLLSMDMMKSEQEMAFDGNISLRNIVHVHGKLDDSIIIGVDNEKQIANESFRNDDDIKDWLVKIQSNHAMKLMKHEKCENLIANANLIILHGVSLGETDLRWWKLIGKELKKRNNIAIIQHLFQPNVITPTTMQRMGKIEREHQKHLMSRMGLKPEDRVETLTNRLFFTVNSNIFNNK